MAVKEKWEEKYEAYKKGLTNEKLEEQWKSKDSEYRMKLAQIKDTNSVEYKKLASERNKAKKEYDTKKHKSDIIKKNESKIEKIKEHRDTYQELLDELLASKEENNNVLQERAKLGKEAERLEKELKELQEIQKHCEIALKNPKATPEQQAHAEKKLKENREKQNKNQLAFSANQLALQEHLAIPLKEVPEADIEELKAGIARDNKICEALVEGKDLRDIITEVNKKEKEDKSTGDKPQDKQEKGKKPEEKTTDEEHETSVNPEGPSAEGTGAKPGNASNEEEREEEEENLSAGHQFQKVASVEVKDNKYIITYEAKNNGVYSLDKKECQKLGFFKGLAERFKIIANRKEYGIDFVSATRADINIFRNLNDKDKEKYLSYIAGQTAGCFDINYDDPKNRYAKKLAKGQERLALKEAEALEQYGPIMDEKAVDLKQQIENELITPKVDSKEHEEKQNKYNEMFGDGFDRHDNPPTVSDKATNKSVKKTVRDILYGDIEQDEK